jgi:hypothetical protein
MTDFRTGVTSFILLIVAENKSILHPAQARSSGRVTKRALSGVRRVHMRFHAIKISAVILTLLVSAAPMRGQTIATTTTLTANPESILFGGFTVITATVTPASGPACALAGLPIQFFTAAGKPMTILDGAGQASIPYDYDPAGDNPATVSADFNYFNYGTSFAPSYGTVTLNVVPPAGILNGTYTFLFKGSAPWLRMETGTSPARWISTPAWARSLVLSRAPTAFPLQDRAR